MRNNSSGFTLIEILVVVIVIGILVAVIVPGMTSGRNITNDASVQAALINAGQAQERYALKYNSYYRTGSPESLTEFGLDDAPNVTFNFVSADVSTYCIQAHHSADPSEVFSIVPGENVRGVTCAAR